MNSVRNAERDFDRHEKEKNVYESDDPFMCLVIDRRFDNCWNLMILYPYICKESESITTFGWVDKNGDVFGNIENSTQLWDEFVVGFQKYSNNDNDYEKLWDSFVQKIENQYDE